MHTTRLRPGALTLVEILIVLAITLVLAALLLPVLASSRRQAQSTSDLEKMRQLGVAASLYHDETGGWALSAVDLIRTQNLPKEICSFATDPSKRGLGNDIAGTIAVESRLPADTFQSELRNSTLGLREFFITDKAIKDFIIEGKAGGWLLEASTAKMKPYGAIYPIGRYRRLCFDTSVVVRPFQDSICTYVDGKAVPCRMADTYYVDPGEEMKKWILSL
jgi:type II secretory pathway pseudopilin PulG